jgi:hypothetical protein
MEKESFFDLNQTGERSFYISVVENAIDSLETAVTFLNRSDNLKWKWIPIALHHSLYSFSIACLENGNYECVLSNGRDDDKNTFIKQGDDEKWKRSLIIRRPNSHAYTIRWEYTEDEPIYNKSGESNDRPLKKSGKLISFWTALARVQDQTFWMGRLTCTKALTLTEEEWKHIEWLTIEIRNGLLHYVPRSRSVNLDLIKRACSDVSRAIEFLALSSKAVVYTHPEQDNLRIKNAVASLRDQLVSK